MSATNNAAVLPFIVVTTAHGSTPETRRLVRSHVMRGKRWKKKPRQISSRDSTSVTHGLDTAEAAFGRPIYLQDALLCSIPAKVGSDLSFTQFADHMEPSEFDNFLRFSAESKKILFPLEFCVILQKPAKAWIETLATDAAYLNAVVFLTKLYRDLATGCQPGTAGRGAVQRLQKALRLLRERLSAGDEEATVSDATIMIVVIFANHARMVGDYRFAKHHTEGLRKILDLRGGMSTFGESNKKLLLEILRCDVGVALYDGAKPLFFSDGHFVPFPDLSLPIPQDSSTIWNREDDFQKLRDLIAEELVQVWCLMRQFCMLINLAAAARRQITQQILLETMASVMYRLLNMSFPSGSLSETVRLGLLVFSSHIFLQWQGIRLSYAHFSNAYRNCLACLRISESIPPSIILWLLVIGAISVFTEADSQLLNSTLELYIARSGAQPWSEARNILKRFLWIDCLHDKPGRVVFDIHCSGRGA